MPRIKPLFRRRWLTWLTLCGLLALIGISIIPAAPTFSQTLSDLCTITVQESAGQGRFATTGLGRFATTGLEGANATLEAGDGGLTQAQIDEILNNVISSSWVIEQAWPTISGENGGDKPGEFGTEAVAILIIDDFTDQSFTLDGILNANTDKDWEDQISEYYGSSLPGSLEIPVVPHGETVYEVAQDAIDRINAFYTENGILPPQIDLYKVDISQGGQYRLDLLVPAIQSTINQLSEQYSRFVLNMSFGIIPCSESSEILRLGGSSAFSLGGWLDDIRYREFVFDVDGGLDVEEQVIPAVYPNFGLDQYFVQDLKLPGEALPDYWRFLFQSVNVVETTQGLRQSNPDMDALRTLLQSYLAQNGNSDLVVLPFAASGNYRDYLEYPLAPANLQETIAIGATLGESQEQPVGLRAGDLWEFSQDANMIAPGAWHQFGDGSFRAGTSFSTPLWAVIGANYLTYSEACTFNEFGLPLVNPWDDFGNYYFSDGNLSCEPSPDGGLDPTATPIPTSPDLIVTSMRYTLDPNESCLFTGIASGIEVSVSNVGTGNAGPFVVQVQTVGESNFVTGNVNGLATGASTTIFIDNFGWGVSAVRATVDSTNVVLESDELNNTLEQVLPQPTPYAPCTATPTGTPPTATLTPTPSATATVFPTPTATGIPSGQDELVANGSFEMFDETNQPVGWKAKRPTKDRVRCNKVDRPNDKPDKIFSSEGDCAYRFKGGIGERSALKQVIDPTALDIQAGARVEFFADVDVRNEKVNNLKLRVLVKYNDDTPTGKFIVTLTPTAGYEQITGEVTIVSSDVNKIIVKMTNRSDGGSAYIDAVSLQLIPALSLPPVIGH